MSEPIINKIDEILLKHHLSTSSASNRAMQEYADWVAEKMAQMFEIEKERSYNRGYVDGVKRFEPKITE